MGVLLAGGTGQKQRLLMETVNTGIIHVFIKLDPESQKLSTKHPLCAQNYAKCFGALKGSITHTCSPPSEILVVP